MKVNKAIVLLGALAILVLGTAASDEGIKVGVVDIDQAISSTDKGKAAREEFARKQREAQSKFQPLIDKYTALEEELKAEGSARLEQHEERATERMARQVEEDDRRRTAAEAPQPDEVPGKRPRVEGPDDPPDEHMGDPETSVSYLLNVHREAYIQDVQHTEEEYPVCVENYPWGKGVRT